MKKNLFRRVVALALAMCMLVFSCIALAEDDDWNQQAAPDDVQTTDSSENLLGGWWHILLLGCDSYSQNNYSRSDSMIMLSLNPETGKAKLTSFMRDTWIKVPGTDKYRKLTEVCAVGGPQLTMDTINANFSTQLTEYALVSMKGIANIIDMVGGLDLDVTEAERKALNKGLFDLSDYSGMEKLEKSGDQVHLNGNQATAYARIRKIDSDFVRVERQQTVLTALANKIMQDANVGTLMAVATEMLQYVDTNLTFTQIMDIAYMGMSMDLDNIETLRVPVDGTYKSGNFDGVYSIRPDFDANKRAMYDFIYTES